MHCHLVAVEVRVECRANERVNLDGLAFNQHRLKRLNTKAVKSWRAVQKDWMLANHFFENVPDHRLLTFNHFSRLLDSCCMALLFQLVIDKRLKQLERHLLRQTTLMEFQLGTNDDHRTSGIVDAF